MGAAQTHSILPSTQKPYHSTSNKTHVFFDKWEHMFFHENVLYADIETFFSESDLKGGSTTKAYHSIASIGMHAVGRQGPLIPPEFEAQLFIKDIDCDPFVEFMRKLLRLCMYWRFCKKNPKPLVVKHADDLAFAAASKCQLCGEFFEGQVVKCRDHNHYTGEFRAALCNFCNIAARTSQDLRVFAHNGTGLARLMTIDMDLRGFAGTPEEWLDEDQDVIPLRSCNINVLAESSKKLRSIISN
jgi:hypothetical protein